MCAYPRVKFPSRLTRRLYLLSKRRHCLVERTTKEPASRVLRTYTHIHTGLLCIFVTLLIQWRHVDRHLYCYWSMPCPKLKTNFTTGLLSKLLYKLLNNYHFIIRSPKNVKTLQKNSLETGPWPKNMHFL